MKSIKDYVVGCLNNTPHSCLTPLSLRKPVGKGGSITSLCVRVRHFGERGTISLLRL